MRYISRCQPHNQHTTHSKAPKKRLSSYHHKTMLLVISIRQSCPDSPAYRCHTPRDSVDPIPEPAKSKQSDHGSHSHSHPTSTSPNSARSRSTLTSRRRQLALHKYSIIDTNRTTKTPCYSIPLKNFPTTSHDAPRLTQGSAAPTKPRDLRSLELLFNGTPAGRESIRKYHRMEGYTGAQVGSTVSQG